MQFDPDDPRWTAYVLGELDAPDMAELEQQARQSAAAQQHLDELRQTIGLLSAELESEPVLQLSPEQRSAVERESLAPAVAAAHAVELPQSGKVSTYAALKQQSELKKHQADFAKRWLGVLFAVAASLLVVATLVVPGLQNANRPTEVAQTQPHDKENLQRFGRSQGKTWEYDGSQAENGRAALGAQFGNTAPAGGGQQTGVKGLQRDHYAFPGEPLGAESEKHERFYSTTGPAKASDARAKENPDWGINKPVLETRTKSESYMIQKPVYHAQTPDAFNAPVTTRQPAAGLGIQSQPGGYSGPVSGPNPTTYSVDYATPVVPLGSVVAGSKGYSEAAPQSPSQQGRVGESRGGIGGGGGGGGYGGDVQSLAKTKLGRQPISSTSLYSDTLSDSDSNGIVSNGTTNVPALVAGGATAWYDNEAKLPFRELHESEADGEQRGLRGEGLVDGRRHDLDGFDAIAMNEAYDQVTDNAFRAASDDPLSTFSIDVDTASYSNVRRFLVQNHRLPPKSAVRIEEMLNYFSYDYAQPDGDVPFSANAEVAECPWNVGHRLVRIGLKGREIAAARRPPSNLVFLVDVSGSMNEPNKLPLVKQSLRMLAEQLTENDRVGIVVYAGNSGLVLPSTTGNNRETIITALDRLEAGGSTNGGQGIQLAYEIATSKFIPGGTNRVLLATDGDFNVGITDRDKLVEMIEQQAKSGVFLTTLGYGFGNLKDATLEQLADHGNGNYAYIDDVREAKKVFVEQMSGTLITIAKDVKIQIEFNPAQVGSYRLIGYENRVLAHQDFNNDLKDAGDIGAGHTVTALYEIVPPAKADVRPVVDPLKYQQNTKLSEKAQSGELLTLKLRYKQPEAKESKLLEYPVKDSGHRYGQASGDFKFAAAVAAFGMLLRDSPHKGTATMAGALELAQEGQGSDEKGYRQEFVSLIQQAKAIYEATHPAAPAAGGKVEEPITHAGPVKASGEAVTSTTPLAAADSVFVEWGGTWWKATVVDVNPHEKSDGNVKIHYSGWESQWDEVVPRSRLRK